MGAVLHQFDSSERLQPVSFYYRELLSAETHYPVYEKELLAISRVVCYKC
jgi:hypothetical protein